MEIEPHAFYCFLDKKTIPFSQWVNHADHHSELFYLSEAISDFYKFEECLLHTKSKNTFKMSKDFFGDLEVFSLSTIYMTPQQSTYKQELAGCMVEGISPYVLKYNDIFYEAEYETLVTVSEFCAFSLKDEIPKMHEKAKMQTFQQICEGVRAFHENGYFHGLMAQSIAQPNYETIYTYSDKMIWPPEFLQGKNINEKFDVWALGILLHQMLCELKYPFKEEKPKLLHNKLRENWGQEEKAMATLRIGKEVQSNEIVHELIKKCLKYDPSKRIRLDELIWELKKLKI